MLSKTKTAIICVKNRWATYLCVLGLCDGRILGSLANDVEHAVLERLLVLA